MGLISSIIQFIKEVGCCDLCGKKEPTCGDGIGLKFCDECAVKYAEAAKTSV